MPKTASRIINVDVAEAEVRRLAGLLRAGESITLADGRGRPVALLVGLRQRRAVRPRAGMKGDRWAKLARRVTEEWNGDQGAVAVLSEMRR